AHQPPSKKREPNGSNGAPIERRPPAALAALRFGSVTTPAAIVPRVAATAISLGAISVSLTLLESPPFWSIHACSPSDSAPRTDETATILPSRSFAERIGPFSATISCVAPAL